MSARRRLPVAHLLTAALVGVGLAGCDSAQSVAGPDGGEERQFSTVEGRVESTNQTASSGRTSMTGTGPAPAAGPAASASTVAVAAVEGDGALDVLAEAEVRADGSFRVEEVPVGRSDLVVVARSEAEEEVGRVLVHGETQANAVHTTAPINGETTVEGHVFATLKAAGAPEEVRNTAQLALLIRMDESTASDVAASAQAIQEVSDGVRAGVEAMNQTLAATQARVDGRARAEAMLQAAVEHAQSRHEGAEAHAASEAFLQAGIEALSQAGATAEEAALATTVAATGLDRAMAEANENARLELARNAVALNLVARKQLAAEASEGPARDAAVDALGGARAEVEASASVSEVARALLDAETSAQETIMSLILSSLSDVPDEVRAQVEARLESAFVEADFSARAETDGAPAQIAGAITDYQLRVHSAVDAFRDSLPTQGSVSAQVSAELLVAVRGGPDVGRSAS